MGTRPSPLTGAVVQVGSGRTGDVVLRGRVVAVEAGGRGGPDDWQPQQGEALHRPRARGTRKQSGEMLTERVDSSDDARNLTEDCRFFKKVKKKPRSVLYGNMQGESCR
jgi:hypothetical protein